jgi:hypothetical protein
MPDVEWSLTCDYCLLDQAGKLSIIGIFERIVTQSVPVMHPALFVVTRWRNPSGEAFTAQTRVWTPTEQLLVSTGPTHVPPNPAGQHVTIDQFRGVVFEREGQYLVELLSADETARYYPLQVVVVPGPP